MSNLSISQIARNQSVTITARPVNANISIPNFDFKIDDLNLQLNTQGLGNFSNTDGDSPTIDPTLFKYLELSSNTSDFSFKLFGKNRFEIQTAIDQSSRQISSLKLETVNTLSNISFDTTRGLSSAFAANDLFQISSSKILEDISTAIDSVSLAPNKQLESSAISLDSREFTIEPLNTDLVVTTSELFKDITRVLATQFTYTDLNFKDIFKNTSDFTTNQDSLFSIFTKGLDDVVDANDDFLGESVADDDQIVTFVKALNDKPITTDLLTRIVTFNREAADIALAQDLLSANFSKPLSSQFTQSDILSYLFDKTLFETLSTISFIVFAVNKELSTIAILSDFIESNFGKDLNSSANASESFELDVNTAYADIATTSEILLKALSRNIESNTTALSLISSHPQKILESNTVTIDSIANLANKNLLTSVSTTDIVIIDFQINRIISDLVNSISEISINSNKVLQDQFGFSDINLKDVFKVISSEQQEFYFSEDYLELTEIKPGIFVNTYTVFTKANEGLTLDTVELIATFERSINDVLNITDDFLGSAVSDDDQTVLFIKNLEETVSSGFDTVSKELLRNIVDSFTIEDLVSNSVDKALENSALISDLTELLVNSTTIDILGTVDENTKDTLKSLNSNSFTSTLVSISNSKSIEDIITVNDLLSNSLSKTFVNEALLNDLIELSANILKLDNANTNDLVVNTVGKVVNTNASTTALLSLDSVKLLQDNFTTDDTFTLVAAFERSFNDIQNVTDDFLGSAVSDDDQTILFVKNLEESLSSGSDIVSKELLREILDSFTIEDLAEKLLSKPKEDVFSVQDTIINSSGLNKAETVSLSDDISNIADKRPIEVLSVIETINLALASIRDIADLSTISQLISISLSSIKEDALDISDLSLSSIGKNNSNIIEPQDTISKTSAISFSDLLSNSDSISIASAKAISNSLVTSDSGSIWNQSYFSEDYVLIGYVGTVTTI